MHTKQVRICYNRDFSIVTKQKHKNSGQYSLTCGHMIESDPDTPEVHRGAECLAHGFPEHGALVHVGVEVLLRPVQRHELLVVLQLPRSTEIGELVDNTAVILDELHDVAGLEVAVDEVVVAEVVHAGAEVGEHQQELVLVQPVAVLGVVQEVEQAAARAQLHHDHLGRWCRLYICEVSL